MNAEALAASLTAAWRARVAPDAEIAGLRQLSAGASASTWKLEAVANGQREALVLQLFAGGDNPGFALDKAAQGRVQATAAKAGIPTPPVRLIVGAADGLPPGFLSSYQPGETLGKKIAQDPALEAARAVLPQQCAQALAQIHALDPSLFPELPLRGAAAQLEVLAALHRGYGEYLPVFEMAIAWLRRQRPPEVTPRVVHGDFRNGNWIVGADGLKGVLDWELSHLGDPMEDLGWLCMRSWRFGRDALAAGGIATRQAFAQHYAQAAGTAPDLAALRWWETFGALKWGVICQWFADQYRSGAVREIERAVIGRRVSEAEAVMLDLVENHDA